MYQRIFTIHRDLVEGDVLRDSEGLEDRWHVLHTPGHASGHIVLWEPMRRVLIGGDMVAALGTIIVHPPDGHMATYMAQLERLAELNPDWLVPAHGMIIEAPVEHLRAYVAHRMEREGHVLRALELGEATLEVVTRRSYPELPSRLMPLAQRSCLAHLIKLEEEGRAQVLEQRWKLRL